VAKLESSNLRKHDKTRGGEGYDRGRCLGRALRPGGTVASTPRAHRDSLALVATAMGYPVPPCFLRTRFSEEKLITMAGLRAAESDLVPTPEEITEKLIKT